MSHHIVISSSGKLYTTSNPLIFLAVGLHSTMHIADTWILQMEDVRQTILYPYYLFSLRLSFMRCIWTAGPSEWKKWMSEWIKMRNWQGAVTKQGVSPQQQYLWPYYNVVLRIVDKACQNPPECIILLKAKDTPSPLPTPPVVGCHSPWTLKSGAAYGSACMRQYCHNLAVSKKVKVPGT